MQTKKSLIKTKIEVSNSKMEKKVGLVTSLKSVFESDQPKGGDILRQKSTTGRSLSQNKLHILPKLPSEKAGKIVIENRGSDKKANFSKPLVNDKPGSTGKSNKKVISSAIKGKSPVVKSSNLSLRYKKSSKIVGKSDKVNKITKYFESKIGGGAINGPIPSVQSEILLPQNQPSENTSKSSSVKCSEINVRLEPSRKNLTNFNTKSEFLGHFRLPQSPPVSTNTQKKLTFAGNNVQVDRSVRPVVRVPHPRKTNSVGHGTIQSNLIDSKKSGGKYEDSFQLIDRGNSSEGKEVIDEAVNTGKRKFRFDDQINEIKKQRVSESDYKIKQPIPKLVLDGESNFEEGQSNK